jgi:uncharacterized protein YihD (DUF1040 family)
LLHVHRLAAIADATDRLQIAWRKRPQIAAIVFCKKLVAEVSFSALALIWAAIIVA